MLGEAGSRYALAISLLAHLALVVTTTVVAAEPEQPLQRQLASGAEAAPGGNTFDIDSLIDDPVAGQGDDAADPAVVPPAPAAHPAKDQGEALPPAPPPPTPSPPAPAGPPEPPAPPLTPPADHAPSTAPDHAPSTERAAGSAPAGAEEPGKESSAAGRGRRYGAAGGRRGVRDFARAFTRAVPAAVSADAAWAKLPLGVVGRLEITVEVDDNARIVAHHVEPDDLAPPLRRIIKRTMPLLAGEFALSAVDGAGSETMRVEVSLSQREPLAELVLGHELPSAGRSGRAYFTLASGRHFEATIVLLRSEPKPQSAGGHAPPRSGSLAD